MVSGGIQECRSPAVQDIGGSEPFGHSPDGLYSNILSTTGRSSMGIGDRGKDEEVLLVVGQALSPPLCDKRMAPLDSRTAICLYPFAPVRGSAVDAKPGRDPEHGHHQQVPSTVYPRGSRRSVCGLVRCPGLALACCPPHSTADR